MSVKQLGFDGIKHQIASTTNLLETPAIHFHFIPGHRRGQV